MARVWDTLFSEGPKVLFRVALAVLKLLEPALLAQEDTGELLGVLRASTHGMINRDQLLKVRCGMARLRRRRAVPHGGLSGSTESCALICVSRENGKRAGITCHAEEIRAAACVAQFCCTDAGAQLRAVLILRGATE